MHFGALKVALSCEYSLGTVILMPVSQEMIMLVFACLSREPRFRRLLCAFTIGLSTACIWGLIWNRRIISPCAVFWLLSWFYCSTGAIWPVRSMCCLVGYCLRQSWGISFLAVESPPRNFWRIADRHLNWGRIPLYPSCDPWCIQ